MSSHADRTTKGIVFNIQKYSVHDGPGIRTIIFLKGCSLRCRWCSNPESQLAHMQLAYNPSKCLGVDNCPRCRDVCPRGALSVGQEGKMLVDWRACDDCLLCVRACPNQALNSYGYEVSVDQALSRVEEDDVFYSRSGGGLTLSGGEPLFQAEFALSLLREARRRYISTCIETCGQVPWPVLEEASRYLNNLFYDIKAFDSQRHEQGTGFDNQLILENLRKLKQARPELPVVVRTPVIPGFNDDEAEIAAIVEFIKDMPNTEYELLAYHRMGKPKYGYLGRSYPLEKAQNLDKSRIEELRRFARRKLERRRRAG